MSRRETEMRRSVVAMKGPVMAGRARMTGSWSRVAPSLPLLLAIGPGGAVAQDGGDPGGFWSQLENNLLVYAQAAIPTGEFGDHLRLGGGGGFASMFWLSGSPHVALRIEANVSGFGHGDAPRALGARIHGENSMFAGGIGPQIQISAGRFRPYLFGTWGIARFDSELEGWDDDLFEDLWFDDDRFRHDRGRIDDDWFEYWLDDRFPDDDHRGYDGHGDLGVSLSAGGGLGFEVYRGGVPVAFDLSVSYRHYGGARLARAGSVADRAALLAIMERYGDELRNSYRDRRRPNLGDDFLEAFGPVPAVDATVNLVNVRFGVSVGLF